MRARSGLTVTLAWGQKYFCSLSGPSKFVSQYLAVAECGCEKVATGNCQGNKVKFNGLVATISFEGRALFQNGFRLEAFDLTAM